LHSVHNNNYP